MAKQSAHICSCSICRVTVRERERERERERHSQFRSTAQFDSRGCRLSAALLSAVCCLLSAVTFTCSSFLLFTASYDFLYFPVEYCAHEFIGVLFRDDEEGETSYQFQMAILDFDLSG